MPARRLAFLSLLVLGQMIAGPVSVTLQGNFGPSTDSPTIFDNQNYVVSFLIPNPAAPDQQVVAPEIDQFSVTYFTSGSLSVPAIGLFTSEALSIQLTNQLGRSWLNIFQFDNVPAGDFLLATPVEALSGRPLWNGLAGAFGTPEIFTMNAEPANAFWRLQQIPPGSPASIPLASYPAGSAQLTIEALPEPATFVLVVSGVGMLFAVQRARQVRGTSKR